MIDATGMPQSAVLLGGTSEIGLAIVEALARARLERVLLVGRDEAGLEAARKRLGGAGCANVETLTCDVTVPADLSGLAGRASASIGPVDLLVVSVGELGTADLEQLDGARVAALFAVNAGGPAGAMTEFASEMVRQGHGRIVVLSSVAGLRVRRANFVYGAGKAGLDGFSLGLAEALRPHGIGVTVVRPGFVKTRMTDGLAPAPLSTDAPAVARAVVSALGQGSEVVYVPGLLRYLFGFVRVLPAAVFRRLPG